MFLVLRGDYVIGIMRLNERLKFSTCGSPLKNKNKTVFYPLGDTATIYYVEILSWLE
ncbi:hypothetical protein YERSI8AC_180143 [Enterobacterales bacterium 8AC]|nr:hypothetical protein YERSI8AC_180143 [Enterobacterales bacterium 8AC]